MGRYRYRQLPFGITHAGDDYCRHIADVFDSIPNSRRVVEDIITPANSCSRSQEWISGGTSWKVMVFPAPRKMTDLRSFFGLCQQVGNFSSQIAAALVPPSPLLKKNLVWEWTTFHDEAFKRAREKLSTAPDLSFYDPAHRTALHVDASRLHGLGFVLKQLKPDGGWRVVQAGSRFLSSEESRYAMIELECLSAAWAMVKCQQFIEGLPSFELITDHKPLVPILNDYALDKLDKTRLLRLRLKMQRFSFTARWIPGKSNVDADSLSPALVNQP